ncbi:MAG TPA: glycosyltransferase [Paludibacteraceae bacterium]|nr:glycosyltransferase [Paludibacteraceae bacterium]HPT42216.1 glycosyltransferase [Paludibacteraceae bacterium]
MKASLIISVYKNIRFLKPVLDSLHFQTEKDFETIISEDGESPEMKEFIAGYPFEMPYKHITRKDEGWRKNHCLNSAIRASEADWLIFIDGDCVLHPRFIEMHLHHAEVNKILAGKRVKLDDYMTEYILDNSDNIRNLQQILLRKMFFGKGKIKFIEEGIFISPESILRIIPRNRKNDKLVGCNMSFSKEAIYAINGFDEDYKLPAVGEDYDLAWRLKAAGFQLVSMRNLAVQYHLSHPEGYNQDFNLNLCRQKQEINEFVCKNGLDKH